MSARVYVGNLSWNTTDDTLRPAFSDFGQVLDSVTIDGHEPRPTTQTLTSGCQDVVSALTLLPSLEEYSHRMAHPFMRVHGATSISRYSLSPNCQLNLVVGIADGLNYLHKTNNIHSNLPPNDFLVGSDSLLYLPVQFVYRSIFNPPDPDSVVARARYTAPELVSGLVQQRTKQCDVYVFGSIAMEVS